MSQQEAIWWAALAIQLVAIPGTLFPVLPGLALLPLGAGLWVWSVGWAVGWPALVFASLILLLGWGADALGMLLGAARLQATRWDGIADMNDPAVARRYLDHFNEVWIASEPARETRELRL